MVRAPRRLLGWLQENFDHRSAAPDAWRAPRAGQEADRESENPVLTERLPPRRAETHSIQQAKRTGDFRVAGAARARSDAEPKRSLSRLRG